MNRDPLTGIYQPSKFQKAIAAGAAVVTVGVAAKVLTPDSGSQKASDAPHYQPFNLEPTPDGSRVPKGYEAPVGETVSGVPGHPNEERIQFNNPDGHPIDLVGLPPGASSTQSSNSAIVSLPVQVEKPATVPGISNETNNGMPPYPVEIPPLYNPGIDVGPTPGAPKIAPENAAPTEDEVASHIIRPA